MKITFRNGLMIVLCALPLLLCTACADSVRQRAAEEQRALESAYDDGYDAGYSEGYDDAYDYGYEDAYRDYEEGYSDGDADGFREGYYSGYYDCLEEIEYGATDYAYAHGGWHPEEAGVIIEEYESGIGNHTYTEYREAVDSLWCFYAYFYGKEYDNIVIDPDGNRR